MSLGLTVGNLRAMWEGLDPNTLVEVSVAGMNGLVVRSASVEREKPRHGAHLTVGPITARDVRVEKW